MAKKKKTNFGIKLSVFPKINDFRNTRTNTQSKTSKNNNFVSPISGFGSVGLSIKAEVLKVPLSLSTKFLLKTIPIKGRNNKKKIDLSGDKLTFSEIIINNSEFKMAGSVENLSTFRPEILSMFNFHSIYEGDANLKKLNSYGKFLELNYQTSYVHKNISVELFANMENYFSTINDNKNEGKKALQNLKNATKDHLNNVKSIIDYQKQTIETLDLIEEKFDLKAIPEYKFSDSLSFKEYFTHKAGYKEKQYDSFTNTKLYFQLLIDLKGMLETYSFDLLNLKDEDRTDDYDPVTLDKTYKTQDKFTFSVKQLGSSNTTIDGLDKKVFDDFLNSLPKEIDRKLKVLITTCSKELTVSKQLGIKKQLGNPFDNLIGIPGSTIFEKPLGDDSLSSLGFITPNLSIPNNFKNLFVLPLEKKYLDIENKPTHFIPGSSYLVDTIFQTNNTSPNITPINDYINQFMQIGSTRVNDIKEFIDPSSNDVTTPTNYYQFILYLLTNSFNELNSIPKIIYNIDMVSNLTDKAKNTLILMSIMKLANQEKTLKHLLFQYFVLVGLHMSKQSDFLGRVFWETLANEIGDLRNFPFFKTNIDINYITKNPYIESSLNLTNKDKNSSYDWALDMLAEEIEKKVSRILLSKNKIDKNDSNKRKNKQTSKSSVTENLKKSLSKTNINSDRLEAIDIELKTISDELKNSHKTGGVLFNFCSFLSLMFSGGNKNEISSNNQSFFIEDTSRTRFNFVSSSGLLLMNYEILSNIVAGFFDANMVSHDNKVFVFWDTAINKYVLETMSDAINDNFSSNTKSESSHGRHDRHSNNNNRRTNSNLETEIVGRTNDDSSLHKQNKTFDQIEPKISITNDVLSLDRDTLAKTKNFVTNDYGNIDLKKRKSIQELLLYKEKFINEYENIKIILHILRVFSAHFQATSVLINKSFSSEIINQKLLDLSFSRKRDPSTGQRLPATDLKNFRYPFTFEKLKQVRNLEQIFLNFYHYLKYLERFTQPDFDSLNTRFDIDSINTVSMDLVSKETKNTLMSYLSSEEFSERGQANTKMKILSIGIPEGFRSNLVDRFVYNKLSKTKKNLTKQKQLDLIEINVYKRDLRNMDIIFKPQTFLFDLSLFLLPSGITSAKPELNQNFSKILNKIVFTNFESTNGELAKNSESNISLIKNDALNSRSISDLESYDIITKEQKNQLLKNHAINALLEAYVQLMTGIKMCEETFTNLNDSSIGITSKRTRDTTNTFEEFVEKAIMTYLKDGLQLDIPNGISLQGLLESDNIDQEIKNNIRTITLGNEHISPLTFRSKILNNKSFERVLNIPVNIDSFEIDEVKTKKSNSGKKTIEQLLRKNKILQRNNKLIFNKQNDNDITLEDLFVTIDNVL